MHGPPSSSCDISTSVEPRVHQDAFGIRGMPVRASAVQHAPALSTSSSTTSHTAPNTSAPIFTRHPGSPPPPCCCFLRVRTPVVPIPCPHTAAAGATRVTDTAATSSAIPAAANAAADRVASAASAPAPSTAPTHQTLTTAISHPVPSTSASAVPQHTVGAQAPRAFHVVAACGQRLAPLRMRRGRAESTPALS